jgi:hypothetical protein
MAILTCKKDKIFRTTEKVIHHHHQPSGEANFEGIKRFEENEKHAVQQNETEIISEEKSQRSQTHNKPQESQQQSEKSSQVTVSNCEEMTVVDS